MRQEIENKRSVLISYEPKLTQSKKTAGRLSKFGGFLVAQIILGELAFITYGTFVEWSWDIVEPMSYLIGLFNFSVTFAWAALHITRLD